jgi:RNA polymerase sigma factor (sigma-70 family)
MAAVQSIAECPTVYIVDDDESVREAVVDLLQSIGLQVQTFGSTQDFVGCDHSAAPACLLLDIRLPGISGLDFQQKLLEAEVRLPVIFITGHGNISMSVRAMKNGAIDFLTKPIDEQRLLDAIEMGLERDRQRRRAQGLVSELKACFETLTPRERQILALVVTGRRNRLIASELGVSEMTVKVHRGQIMRKMKAASLIELVRMADNLGITDEK